MSEIDSLTISINAEDNASDVIDRVSQSVRGLGNSNNSRGANSVSSSIEKIGKEAGKITKPLAIAAAAVGGLEVAGAKAAIDFEDSFAAVQKTVDGTPEQIDKIKKSIIDMTTVGINGHGAIPMTTRQLNELAAAGGQLGIATENIPKFTETMAQLETATNLGGEQGAQTLAQFMNVANVSQDLIPNLGSAIVDLGNNYATTEADIMNMAMSMGSTASMIGFSAQEILAYSTALNSTGTEAAAGGSAMTRILMDIQSAVSAGDEELQKFAEISGKTSEEFAQQWENDASGAFQSFLEGFGKLNKSEQVGLLTKLGFNNVNDIKAIQRLAGEKGFGILTDAIKRSNEAWKENTALQTEFDAKAKTTQSQMQIAKNNIVEAGRSFGEVMLPTIASTSTKVADVAKGMAKMSDESKKAAVKTATAFTVAGLGAKGFTGAVTGIGEFLDAKNKLKEYADAGSKLAGVFTAVGSAAVPATIAVGGFAAACVAANAANNYFERIQLRSTERMREHSQAALESAQSLQELTSLQKELNTLNSQINSGELKDADLDSAKSRIQEIVELLNQKYKLNVDVGDLKAVNEAIDKLKAQSKVDLAINKSDAMTELTEQKESYDDIKARIEENTASLNSYNSQYQKIAEGKTAVATLKSEWAMLTDEQKKSKTVQDEYKQQIKDIVNNSDLPEYFRDAINSGKSVEEMFKTADSSLKGFEGALTSVGSHIDDLKEKLEVDNQSAENIKATADSLATLGLAEMSMGDTANGLKDIAFALQKCSDLDVSSFAQQATAIQTGFNDINSAMQGNDLTGYLNTFVSDMQAFGQNADQITDGISDLFSGLDFSNIDASGLEQINTALQNFGMTINTVDGKKVVVTLNAEDNTSQGTESAKSNIDGVEQKNPTNVKINAKDNTAPGVNAAKQNINSVQDKTVTITVRYSTVGTPIGGTPNLGGFLKKAKGTQNFEGGLAMVNDQAGISDPRELIIDKGRAFIPYGKNVILPLSKGAKVYTASQTKTIMSGLGIPHYADGKDNSDAFKASKEDWTHVINSRAVTVTEELKHWNEELTKFRNNTKDAEDIQEELFKTAQKMRKELNADSEAYIFDRITMNDWDTWGDNAIAAFGRISERERQYIKEGTITEREANEYIVKLGKDMYESRVSESLAWLDHEKKYNGMSVDDYIKGLDRMKVYTEEYYAEGLITSVEYYTKLQEINDRTIDQIQEKNAKEYSDWQKDANQYKARSELYGWNNDSIISYWERYIAQIQKFYDEDKISYEEYVYDIQNAQMELYRSQTSVYDDMLKNAKAYVDNVESSMREAKQAYEDAYDMKKLNADIKEQQELLKLYRGAITARGKAKYDDAKAKLEDYQHEKGGIELEKRQAEAVEKLNREYLRMETSKKTYMAAINGSAAMAAEYVKTVNKLPEDLTLVMGELLTAIRGINIKANSNTYGDTHYNINMPNVEGNFIYSLTKALGGY